MIRASFPKRTKNIENQSIINFDAIWETDSMIIEIKKFRKLRNRMSRDILKGFSYWFTSGALKGLDFQCWALYSCARFSIIF